MQRTPIRRRRLSAAPERRNPRPRRRGFLRQFVVGFLLFSFIALAVAAVWYGSRLEALTITAVRVEGGETISHAAVRNLAEAELRGEYYRLIPRRFAWSYPEEVIIAKVKELPRVKDAVIKRIDRNTILISVSEYYPFALWCKAAASAGEESGCVFLDAEGYAFIEAPPLFGSSMLRYIDPAFEPRVGDRPFDAGFMSATHRFASAAGRELGFAVAHIERIAANEVVYHLSGGAALKVSLRQSAEETFGNLSAILDSEEFGHLRPDNFQYIDLRFGNKVFVNEELPLTATTTATSSAEL